MPTTLTAYTFNELTPDAQACAIKAMPDDDCEWTSDECVSSLRAFADTLGFTLKDWSFGPYSRCFKFDLDDAVKDLSGPRAMAWIENNVFSPIRQSWRPATAPINDAWASIHGKYSRRYHKPDEIKSCPFTGVCFDEEILDVFRDRSLSWSIGDRFAAIGDRLGRVMESELEALNGEAGKRERASDYFDGILFDEYGYKLRA